MSVRRALQTQIWTVALAATAQRSRIVANGYVLIDVSPQQVQCEFRGTLHPVRAQAKFRTTRLSGAAARSKKPPWSCDQQQRYMTLWRSLGGRYQPGLSVQGCQRHVPTSRDVPQQPLPGSS